MTKNLGDHASGVYSAVSPSLAAATHAAPKLFIPSLRNLQAMGVPYEVAVGVLGLACALAVFLAVGLVFWAIDKFFTTVGRGAAQIGRGASAAAAATRERLSAVKRPGPKVPKLRAVPSKASAAKSPEPHSDEPFFPTWDPSYGDDVEDGADEPTPIRRFPSRPPAPSVAGAPRSGARTRLADLTNPFDQTDVPPGFLFVDTSPSEALLSAAASAAASAAVSAAASAVPAAPPPAAPKGSSPSLSIDEAIKLASELQGARDRKALDRALGRGGRSAVAS